MSIKYFLKSKKRQFSFKDIIELLQLSEGYTRQIVSDMVKKKLLTPDKKKKDKRFMIYSLEWSSIREYLLSNPPDFADIILSLVDEQYHGLYIAIDNFNVIAKADTLMELTEILDVKDDDSTVFVTSVGTPKNQIILELS